MDTADTQSGARTVLFVVTSLDVGGAEMQALHLARGLESHGWRVEVASMIGLGPLAARFQAAGIRLHDLRMRRGVPNPFAIIRLARIVRRVAPVIVHSHMIHANLLARVAHPLFRNIPLLNTGQDTNEGHRWRYYAYRYTDQCCDRFHTVSRIALDQYKRGRFASPAKLFYLPNAVPNESTVGNDARPHLRNELALGEAFTFLNVGRLEPQKDQIGLLRAFARLQTGAETRLLVVGTGFLKPALEREAHDLGIADMVRFLDARDDVPALMRAADAFVLSSGWEGLPLVVIEAGRAKLPVVTTAVGDLPLLLKDGHSVLMVPPGDPDALAQAMTRMQVLPPAQRSLMAEQLHKTVCSECDLAKVTDGFERVYHELISERA